MSLQAQLLSLGLSEAILGSCFRQASWGISAIFTVDLGAGGRPSQPCLLKAPPLWQCSPRGLKRQNSILSSGLASFLTKVSKDWWGLLRARQRSGLGADHGLPPDVT